MRTKTPGWRPRTLQTVKEELLSPDEELVETATLAQDNNFPQLTILAPVDIKTAALELAAAPAKKVRVAILSEEGFEQVQFTVIKAALQDAGIYVELVSPCSGAIRGWNKNEWGDNVTVDKNLREAKHYEYDALVLPGGLINPDKLRQNKDAVTFLRQFIMTGKPVAAICHGAQTLIETAMITGQTMTSSPSLETDLRNAGVNWVDREMVHSGQFITSRKAADLDAFIRELIRALNPPQLNVWT